MLRARTGHEDGQVLALTAMVAGLLVGVAALVVDGGTWLLADRQMQSAADAASLAGAQALPSDPARARSLAVDYAARNGGGIASDQIEVSSVNEPNDNITVRVVGEAPGFFSRVFGIASVRVGATAAARSSVAGAVRGVAPIAVDERHPLLACQPVPCFDQPTELTLASVSGSGSNAAGSFGLVDLSGRRDGSVGASTLAEWVRRGYPDYLGPGRYGAAPGAAFNSDVFSEAMAARLGSELVFPVYRSITGSGANARFDVVAWVAFGLESFSSGGNVGSIRGRFTRVTWDAEPTVGGGRDLGVRTLSLVR